MGASSSLELSEGVLTEHKNPEGTEEVMASGSSEDRSSSSISIESMRLNQDHAQSLQLLG